MFLVIIKSDNKLNNVEFPMCGWLKFSWLSRWRFGTWILFSHSIGNIIIPTDKLIFFRGVGFYHQPAKVAEVQKVGGSWTWYWGYRIYQIYHCVASRYLQSVVWSSLDQAAWGTFWGAPRASDTAEGGDQWFRLRCHGEGLLRFPTTMG